MSNRNGDAEAGVVVVILLGLCLAVYLFLKSVGDTIGLPVKETGQLLLGLTLIFGSFGYLWLSRWGRPRLAWWTVPLVFPLFVPALDYWALDSVSKLMLESTRKWSSGGNSATEGLQHAWFGQTIPQVIMFLGLCALAWFINRDD